MPPLKAQVQKDLGFFLVPEEVSRRPPRQTQTFLLRSSQEKYSHRFAEKLPEKENPPESIYFEGRGGTIGHLNMTSGGSEITSLLLQGGTGKEKGGRHENLTPSKN